MFHFTEVTNHVTSHHPTIYTHPLYHVLLAYYTISLGCTEISSPEWTRRKKARKKEQGTKEISKKLACTLRESADIWRPWTNPRWMKPEVSSRRPTLSPHRLRMYRNQSPTQSVARTLGDNESGAPLPVLLRVWLARSKLVTNLLTPFFFF